MQAALRRFWVQVTADRRRFGVLCVVATIGLLLWARMIIVSNMPRTAVAQPRASGSDARAETAESPDGARGAADKSAARSASKDGKGGNGPRQVLDITLHHRAERDPFVISPVYFPKLKPPAQLKQTPGKLPTEAAEDKSRLAARLVELLESVKLEAAMGGTMAVINGKTYRTGDRLPPVGNERIEFTLMEVRQRSIVLEYQGRRFEMEMDAPGNK